MTVRRIVLCLLVLLLALGGISCTSPDETDEGTTTVEDPAWTSDPIDPTGPVDDPTDTGDPIDPTEPGGPVGGTEGGSGEVTEDPNLGGSMPGYTPKPY